MKENFGENINPKKETSDKDLAFFLGQHIANSSEGIEQSNVKNSYIKEAKLAIEKMTDETAKKYLEEIIKNFSDTKH